MADIDQLSIGIEANSKKADKAIDDLCDKLLKLKTALSVGTKMTDFDKAMKSISTNMDSVSDSISRINTDALKTVSKNFNNLAKSISKLATSSEKINFNGATSSANTFIQVAKQGAQEVSKQFGITDAKAIERLEKKFIELADAVNKNSTTQHTIFDDIIDDVKRSKNVIDKFPDEYKSIIQSIQNANKNFKVKLPFSGSEFTNDFSTMRSTLGKAFTSTGNITNAQTIGLDSFIKGFSTQEIQTINSVIQQMGGIVGDTASQFAALVRIKEEYNKATQNTGAVERSSMTTMNALENTVIDSVSAFNNLTRALGQVEINEGKTTNLFQQLANSLNSFSSLNLPDMSNLSMLADSIAKFGYKSSTKGAQNLQTLSAQLPQLVQSLNGVGQVSFQANGLVELANAISKLGGKKATSATANIPTLVGNLHQLISEMNQLQSVSFNTESLTNLASAIAKLGGASVGRAITNLPLLTQELMKMMQTLSKAPAVSQNLINMTTAMGNLHGSARNLTSGSTRNGFKNLFNEIFKGTNKSSKGMKSLAYYFGKFYANFWLLRRGFGLIKSSIDYASDLIEVQNVVDNSFGNLTDKVEEFAKGAIESYGMSELTAKQISSRFQAMGNAMEITNAQVQASNKTWKATSDELDDVSMAYNNTAESMADVSLNLTKLAADIGSFYNEDYDVVAEKLQSVFTGQTRPLREYGIDLTQATIKEWALTQGIEANFKVMTQAEKTMLRYQYVMAHTEQIQNDFIRTQGTWANSTRILKQNLQNLGATIGGVAINAFRPLLAVLNSAIIRLNEFATTVANALGRIFGWTYEAGGGSSASTGLEDIADSANDIADGMGNAADEAERAKQQLQGFDKLNNLSSDTSGSGSSGSGSGSSGGASGGGATSGEWVRTEPLFENYMSDIESLGELGEYISGAITDSLNSINWDNVYSSVRGFGRGLAEFLNGLITPELFSALGRTVGNSINTALYGLNAFVSEFDWDNLGDSISAYVNSMMDSIDWDEAFSLAENFGTGLSETVNSLVDNIEWENVGSTIANFFNTILTAVESFLTGVEWDDVGTALGDIINGFMEFDFATVGRTVATAINDLFIVLKNAIKEVQWKRLGKKIAQGIVSFFDNIRWGNISSSISTAITGLFNFLSGLINGINWRKLPKKIMDDIKDFFVNFEYEETFHSLGGLVSSAFAAGINLLQGLIDEVGDVGQIIKDYFIEKIEEAGFDEDADIIENGKAIITGIKNGILEALVNIGQWIYDNIVQPFKDGFDENLTDENLLGDNELFSTLTEKFETIKTTISNVFNYLSTRVIPPLSNAFSNLVEAFSPLLSMVEHNFSSVYNGILKPALEYLVNTILPRFKNTLTNIKDRLLTPLFNLMNRITSPIRTLIEQLGNRVWENFKNSINRLKEIMEPWYDNVLVPIGQFLGGTFKTAFEAMNDFFNDTWLPTVESLINSLSDFYDNYLEPIGSYIVDVILDAFDRFSGAFDTVWSIGVEWTSDILEWVIEQMHDGRNFIQNLFFKISKKSGSNALIEWVLKQFKIGTNFVKNISAKLINVNENGLISWFLDKIKRNVSVAKDIFSSLKNVNESGIISWFLDKIKNNGQVAKDILSNLVNFNSGGLISWFLTAIKDNVSVAKDILSNLVDSNNDGLISWFLTAIKGNAPVAKDILSKFINENPDSLVSWALNIIKGDGNFLGKIFGKFKKSDDSNSFIESVFNTIHNGKDFIGKIFGKFKKSDDSNAFIEKVMEVIYKGKDFIGNILGKFKRSENSNAFIEKVMEVIYKGKDFIGNILGRFSTNDNARTNIVFWLIKKIFDKKLIAKGVSITTGWKSGSSKTNNPVIWLIEQIWGGNPITANVSATSSGSLGSTLNDVATAATQKAKGGSYHNGMWHNIRQYASGTPTLGLPTPGSLFIAGEAGAEIVANSSRGTEVLNESQIAQSIAIGVNNANSRQNALIAQQNSLLAKQNELLVGIYEKTGISDKDIFESVRRSDRSYQNINGHTAFGY